MGYAKRHELTGEQLAESKKDYIELHRISQMFNSTDKKVLNFAKRVIKGLDESCKDSADLILYDKLNWGGKYSDLKESDKMPVVSTRIHKSIVLMYIMSHTDKVNLAGRFELAKSHVELTGGISYSKDEPIEGTVFNLIDLMKS